MSRTLAARWCRSSDAVGAGRLSRDVRQNNDMERSSEEGVREVMVPHLEATLGMEWSSPPPPVAALLDGNAAPPAPSVPGFASKQCDRLVLRCGAPAVAAVAARLGAGNVLTWRDVVDVQSVMLGRKARFRRADARTAARPERYAILDGLEALVMRKVETDARDSAHDALKGIRLYLDFAFVHPFEDGNARAALLWLAYFYWRSGYGLPRLAGLQRFDFTPGDQACYWAFARLALSR